MTIRTGEEIEREAQKTQEMTEDDARRVEAARATLMGQCSVQAVELALFALIDPQWNGEAEISVEVKTTASVGALGAQRWTWRVEGHLRAGVVEKLMNGDLVRVGLTEYALALGGIDKFLETSVHGEVVRWRR